MSDAGYRWLTPPAPAAIAVLRCPRLNALLDRPLPPPGRARFAHLVDGHGRTVDEVVAVAVDQDRLELCTHGGPGMRRAVEAALADHGLEPAVSGGDGRWVRLARCASPAARDWILAGRGEAPFRPEFLERAALVLITGPPNVGKSTLVNAWCGHRRSVVADRPGTTRDLVTAETLVSGWRLRLVDSAGLGEAQDPLDRAGQDLVRATAAAADLVLHLDPPEAPTPGLPGSLRVQAKADLLERPDGLRWAAPGYAGEAAAAAMLADLAAAVLARLGLPSS